MAHEPIQILVHVSSKIPTIILLINVTLNKFNLKINSKRVKNKIKKNKKVAVLGKVRTQNA